MFFPEEKAFKYNLDKLEGKPWNYEQLIAPMDFPIYKTITEVTNEKNEIKRSRKYYFFRNNDIMKPTNYEAFIRRLKNKKVAAISKEVLDSVARRGIIETSEITEGKKSTFPIYIVENNIEKEHMLGDFFTLRQADQYVEERLEGNVPPNEAEALRDSIENFFAVNIFYNKDLTEKALEQNLENVLPSHGKIMRGQTIINKGEIVTAEKMKILYSLKSELKQEEKEVVAGNYLLLSGQVLVTGMSLAMMMLFLLFFRKNIFSQNSEITFIFLLIIIFCITATQVGSNPANLYYIPFSIAPILIRTFFDTRTALFTHLNIIIIVSFLAADKFSFLFIELFAGIGAIFSVAALSRRSQLFNSIIAVFLTYFVAYFSLRLIEDASSFSFKVREFIPFAVGSATVIFAYPLIYISEKTFGFVSDFTLLELADSNSALLRDLAQKAPGTFQHSLQVASLAEEAVYKVGGNALLVRTGAMYHDIGKIKNPRYFIENMVGGVNPHEELESDESAKIIIRHVLDGVELAKEYKLPEQVIDFIRTHHGTTLTRFFFRSYQMTHEDEIIDEDKFRYPGPVPFSKETAVLMMADSVEAASRSLKRYDAQSIDNLVDKIVASQMEENQYLNSDITFRDVTAIKKIFKKRLMNIYHVRIEYPR